MREPRRISVPAPFTVKSSRRSCSGLTTVTLIFWCTCSSRRFTWRSNMACPRDSAPGASRRSTSVARLTTEGGLPAPTTRPGRRLRNTSLRVSSVSVRVRSSRNRASTDCAAAASSETSGMAPRPIAARIASTVAALISASAWTISQETASSMQPVRHALAPARRRPSAPASPSRTTGMRPRSGQDPQVEVHRVQRALHDLRAGDQHREALLALRAEQLQVKVDVGLGCRRSPGTAG